MGRNSNFYSGFKSQIVQEALSGVKTSILAKKYQVTAKTINSWVRDFQKDQDPNIPNVELVVDPTLSRLQELEQKYEQAMKLLGEKQLEVEVLTQLVKKTNPAYQPRSK